MMQENIILRELIRNATDYLEQQGYSLSSITKYRRYWKRLEDVYGKPYINLSKYDECFQLMKKEWMISDLNALTGNQRFQLRTVKCLFDFLKVGAFPKYHLVITKDREMPYQGIYNDFCTSELNRGLSGSTIKSEGSIFKRFLDFIYIKLDSSIENLTLEMLKSYLVALDETNFTPQTKALNLSCIKRFLRFLEVQQLIEVPLSYFFKGQVYGQYKELPSHYSGHEIKQVLNKVNRDSALGKRDFLILLLAVQLGIRVSDIRNLKLENIHLATQTLQFHQQKTGRQICLPFNDSILFAFCDYLKNARKTTSEYTHIFLKMQAPYIPYSKNNTFNYILMKYLKVADINYTNRKHGIHSMRHSLAGNMLESGIPISTISGVLGHTSIVTTMNYTRISYQQLKKVALEVPYEK
ncbi:MAG: tyrosine-type recombinase/integrase [Lachnospiraceae bacterium]